MKLINFNIEGSGQIAFDTGSTVNDHYFNGSLVYPLGIHGSFFFSSLVQTVSGSGTFEVTYTYPGAFPLSASVYNASDDQLVSYSQNMMNVHMG